MPYRFEDHTTTALDRVHRAAVEAVSQASDELLRKANETVPFDTSMLQASGQADTRQQGDKILGIVSYDTPYAVKQHEDTTLNHPNRNGHQGRARWLELTALEERERLASYISDYLRRAL